VLLQQEGILAHDDMGQDAEKDSEARESRREVQEEGHRAPGDEDVVREAAEQAEGRQADPHPDEEPPPRNPPLEEVPAAEEDKDGPEGRREGEDGEGGVQDEEGGLVEDGHEVFLVDPQEDGIRHLPREKVGRGEDGQGHRVAMLDPPHPPPRPSVRHDPPRTTGGLLMASPTAIAIRRRSGQGLSIPAPIEPRTMFCVECGREGPTALSLCAACFAKKHRLVEPPPHTDVSRCTECGRLRFEGSWTRSDLDLAIPRILREAVSPLPPFERVSFTHVIRPEDTNNFLLTVKASGRYEGVEIVQDFHVRLRVKPTLCDVCSKQKSRYYEGIVQVRGDGRDLTAQEVREVRTFVRARVDRGRDASGEFLSKIEEIHGGLDFYASSNALGKVLARALAEAYGGTVTTSPKLFGQRGGKEIFRVTSLVRLPAFHRGDVVRHRDALEEVVKIASFVILRDLRSGEERRYKPKDLRGLRKTDAERFATVLETHGREVLATHPDSGAERPVATRGARPGPAIVVWTADGAYVSALPADPSKP